MNTCRDCLEDYPTDETTWQDNPAGYLCDWCAQGMIPPNPTDDAVAPIICGDCLYPISEGCNCATR